MGAQDSEGEAVEFVEAGGVETVTMVWDPTFASWSAFEVTGQPTAVLIEPDGTELGRWRGALDLDDVLAVLP